MLSDGDGLSDAVGLSSLSSFVLLELSGKRTEIFSFFLLLLGIVAISALCASVFENMKEGVRRGISIASSAALFSALLPLLSSVKSSLSEANGFFLAASAACMRTYSRGAMVCLPIGCAITTLLSLRYQFHFRKIQILLPIFLLCFFGALLLLPNIIKRFENAPKESLQTRQHLAASAWNMMKDKPLAGVGLNNWGIKINPPYPYCEYRYGNKRIAKDFKEGIVETSYLLVGAECGFLALAAFLAWLGYYYISACKLVKQLRRTNLFYIPAGIVGGLTAVFLQSTLEWVMKQQVNFIQMMMLFAVLGILRQYSKKFASGAVSVTA
jgi:hypothetical protein